VTEIKFCGMTRAEDAREAARLGAAYVGVIFAGGPRQLSLDRAIEVFEDVPRSVRRVGVFGVAPAKHISDAAQRLELSAIQLHSGGDASKVTELRKRFSGEIWIVLRINSADIPNGARGVFDLADAVLLDAHVEGKLGGTGVTLPWEELAAPLERLRSAKAKLVLAGGLRPENVKEAIRLLRPDLVDVSSGVETAPGIKDHARMRAFRDAVYASP
jgi:phosphoribosylanthranilate isomerase